MNTPEHEDAAVQHVVDRLAAQFDALPAEVVETTVHEVHHTLDDARVRDYVPVLVEHDAKDRLRAAARERA